MAFLSTCPTQRVVLHTGHRGSRLFSMKQYDYEHLSQRLPLTTESFGADGRQPFLLPLLLSFPGASFARVRPRGLPLSVSGARARALAVFTFARARAGPGSSPLGRPGERETKNVSFFFSFSCFHTTSQLPWSVCPK